jgi:hypothetical protein
MTMAMEGLRQPYTDLESGNVDSWETAKEIVDLTVKALREARPVVLHSFGRRASRLLQQEPTFDAGAETTAALRLGLLQPRHIAAVHDATSRQSM